MRQDVILDYETQRAMKRIGRYYDYKVKLGWLKVLFWSLVIAILVLPELLVAMEPVMRRVLR